MIIINKCMLLLPSVAALSLAFAPVEGSSSADEDVLERKLQNTISIPDWSSEGGQYYGENWAGINLGWWHAGHWGQGSGTGFSYYLRAMDLFPRHYSGQFGWGQWVGPGEAAPEGSPCTVNPRALVCIPRTDPFFDLSEEGDVTDCSWPDGDSRLIGCQFDTCGESEQPIWGGYEGGMGYWDYMTGATGAKWMVPAAIAGDYFTKFGGTFLNDFRQPCTFMGGVVQIANNILWTGDAFSFEKDPNKGGMTDGFLGYMMQRTPIGKMHPDDNRNYWTFIVDTENYAGPLMYTSAFFWEHPNSWHPDIKTWADPSVKIGSTQYGVEGGLSTVVVETDEYYYFRIQDTQFPLDDDDTGDSFTSMSGSVEYYDDWALEVLEPILDGSDDGTGTPATIRTASAAAGSKPECYDRFGEFNDELAGEYWGEFLVSRADQESPAGPFTVSGWGIGDDRFSDPGNSDAWCRNRLPIDKLNPALDCDDHKCRLSPYFRIPIRDVDDMTSIYRAQPIPENDMPTDIKEALDARIDEFEMPARRNDGTLLGAGPGETEQACFDQTADDTLYCRRTSDERWLAYRWYRFVDQPELNQVFASLPTQEEQMEAKCYMQARIERLHEMQAKESVPRWFDPPAELPTGKVRIDEGFIVTPPPGYEKGYVPVAVYSKLREKPDDCDVIDDGMPLDEPRPLPTDYYNEENILFWQDYNMDPELCYGTEESGGIDYDPAQTIYLSARDGSGTVYPYLVPNRNQIGEDTLAAPYDEAQCADDSNTSNPNPPTTESPTTSPSTDTDPPTASPSDEMNSPSSTNEPTDMMSDDEMECFPGHTTVMVEGHDHPVALRDVKLGDSVLVQNGKYEPIYSFGHLDATGTGRFVNLMVEADSNNPASPEDDEKISVNHHILQLSPNHMLSVRHKGMIPSSLVVVGDEIEVIMKGASTTKSLYRPVTSIYTSNELGLYAPFTPSGKLVVNGSFVVSCYIAFQESAMIHIGRSGRSSSEAIVTPISFQWLGHAYTFPRRSSYKFRMMLTMMKTGYHSPTAVEESYNGNGLATWVVGGLDFATWIFRQHPCVQAISLTLGSMIATIFTMLDFVFDIFFLMLLSTLGCKALVATTIILLLFLRPTLGLLHVCGDKQEKGRI